MDVKRFTAAAPEISELVKSLASPVRLRILCALSRQEVSVGALAEALGLSMPTISQHLALLRKDRLVSGRRANQTIFYALTDPRIAKIIEGLAEEFCKTTPDP
jgi:DNA-binding transcriptional ArsR family regulator